MQTHINNTPAYNIIGEHERHPSMDGVQDSPGYTELMQLPTSLTIERSSSADIQFTIIKPHFRFVLISKGS